MPISWRAPQTPGLPAWCIRTAQHTTGGQAALAKNADFLDLRSHLVVLEERTVTESEDYVLECIRQWVWSGFHSTDQIESMIDDVLDDDCNAEMLRDCIAPEIARKLAAEAGWPATTDCDRLDRAFRELGAQGICALGNAGYTMSDGHFEVSEVVASAPPGQYTAYCFYHGQDVARAIEGDGVMIAFGALDGDAAASLAVGEAVCGCLRREGFEVVWNGSPETRIGLPGFSWQRRTGS